MGASPSRPLLPAAQGAAAAALPLPPAIPVGLPASLLGQRPDLAASVAQLRAANAQVGVAEGAFYPSLTLTSNFGFASEHLRDLASGGARQFSFGPLALSLPVFDGGRNRANLALSQARYERGLSTYLDVTEAQRSSLAADRTASQIRTQRLLASVAVARALGGGWTQRAALATVAKAP
ncbi:TolC family protein [Massilia sp. MS-15]|uniref:TolC family protein n=1 Tax=Massilia sp. MS-15 TaxID=2878200 RepID=UPI0035A63288